MKKLLLSLIALFMLVPFTAVSEDGKVEDPIKRIHIIILRRQQRLRSQGEEVTITYYAPERAVDVDFNEYIGTVGVRATGADGKIIYDEIVETGVGMGCSFDLPNVNTTYTIHIAGARYEGIGYIYL